MNQLDTQLKTLPLTEMCRRVSSDAGIDIPMPSGRSYSMVHSARLPRRGSVISTHKHYQALQKQSEAQQNIKQNKLNCMFLRRKRQLKQISKQNRNIFVRIQSQKSKYSFSKFDADYKKMSNVRHRKRLKSSNSCRGEPLTPCNIVNLNGMLDNIDRLLKDRQTQIREILKKV